MGCYVRVVREAAKILEEARRRGRSRRLLESDVLIEEGRLDDAVFILSEGSLSITRRYGEDEVTIGRISEPGTVVGEMVSFGGGRRSATVTAETESIVFQLSHTDFESLLLEHPEVAGHLAALAVQRAEEAELTELLRDHFGLADEESLGPLMTQVVWRRLGQGEVLFEEGDAADAAYFVVRGRLLASRFDTNQGADLPLGEVGRGEVVGETGLLRGAPRSATVTALRDSVLGALSEGAFLDLVERRPRVMLQVALNALDRLEGAGRSAPSTVLAVAVADGLSADWITEEISRSLEPFGSVDRLWPEHVDRLLDAADASDAAGSQVGSVRLSRFLHEAEMGTDYLVLDVGRSGSNWARRCMGMADRLLVFVPSQPTDAQREQLRSLLDGCPTGLRRSLVVVNAGPAAPTGTRALLDSFSATDALHVRAGVAEDLARVGRVAAGRGCALVLGGGGGRGFAHLGVQRALEELGFPIDIVGGTSVGGVLATVIADGMSAAETVEWARTHFPSVMDYTLPVVSLIKAERIARSATATFGDRQIEDLWRPYFCVSTNLTASRSFVHLEGSVVLAVRATSAIPGIMPPVPHGTDLLVDGGILNNLPIDVAREMTPVGRIVAVDVAPPRGPGARTDFGLSVSGWSAFRSGLGKKERTHPGISAVLMRSMITASMQERDRQIRAGLADCYLDLDMRGTTIVDFSDPVGGALRGYEAAMPRLEAFLATVDDHDPADGQSGPEGA